MLPEPAIFIIDQCFKVTWRNIFDCYRITPDAVSIGETPEWRTILRHHHACRIHSCNGRGQSLSAAHAARMMDKRRGCSIIQQPRLVNRRGIYGLTINRSSAAPVAPAIEEHTLIPHHRLRHLIRSRRHRPRQIHQRYRLIFISSNRRHKAIVTELYVLNARLLHLVQQVLHFTTTLLQAGAAVRQILVSSSSPQATADPRLTHPVHCYWL